MKKTFLAIPIVVVLFVSIVGGYYFLGHQTSNPSQGGGPYTSPSNGATTVRYKTASFIDAEGIGTKAFSMLIPESWESAGNIRWVPVKASKEIKLFCLGLVIS